MGRIVEAGADPRLEPQRFETVQLTLDLPVQMFAEKRSTRLLRRGSRKPPAVVMNPQTGEVLAMASRPGRTAEQSGERPANAWRTGAINIVYEPGSTFKPFIVAWALQQGVLKPDEVFNCENGEYRMGGRLLRDHHRYGKLNVTDILVKSSNIGMAKIGQRLENPASMTQRSHSALKTDGN